MRVLPWGKQAFWEEIFEYVASITIPFILIGDFNAISSSSDKLGGVASVARFERMHAIKSYIECTELPFMDQRFT